MVEAHSGRLLVRPAPALAGLIEIRGLGIRRLPYEKLAVVGLIVDLAASDAARLPAQEAESTEISGIRLPRLAVAAGARALPHGPGLAQHKAGDGHIRRLTPGGQLRYAPPSIQSVRKINDNGLRVEPAENGQ